MPIVKSLLMSFRAVDYTQSSSMKSNFIALRVEYVVACIITMITVKMKLNENKIIISVENGKQCLKGYN